MSRMTFATIDELDNQGSPIEVRLWNAMMDRWWKVNFIEFECQDTVLASMAKALARGRHTQIIATRQMVIGSYVLDIALMGYTMDGRGGLILIDIECDGHDYHERTKEQAARDKARDRALVAEGYSILRFTGSEIWHRPEQCVDEIGEVIQKELQRRCEDVCLILGDAA